MKLSMQQVQPAGAAAETGKVELRRERGAAPWAGRRCARVPALAAVDAACGAASLGFKDRRLGRRTPPSLAASSFASPSLGSDQQPSGRRRNGSAVRSSCLAAGLPWSRVFALSPAAAAACRSSSGASHRDARPRPSAPSALPTRFAACLLCSAESGARTRSLRLLHACCPRASDRPGGRA